MQHEARMIRLLAAMLAAFALAASVLPAGAAPPGHAALQPAEWTAIKEVIGGQLQAMKAGDGTKAMTYSVPGIRLQFGSPERFMRMVRDGYGALLTARESTFLEGAVVDGLTLQPLQLVLPDNSVVVALYRMEKQKDGAWRIAGCVIAPSKVQST
jgi:DNA-binding transcriptional LysR family regulator